MEIKPLSFTNFPEAAQYIIHDLQEKVRDLKDENKKLLTEKEGLEEEYADLEETLEKTKGALEKKPGALAGWIESPDKVLETVTLIPGVLKELRGLFKDITPAPAIAGVADEQQQKANDILAWLASKPLDVQQKFVTMIQDYSQLADDELMDYVDYTLLKIHRQAV